MNGERLQDQEASLGQAAKVALLRQPDTYPQRPERIEVVETHMSWIFLTERHAYKLKKPLRYDFLDFSTLSARQKNCAEEVRLNRRLARDVYLGTVTLSVDQHGRGHLDGSGVIVDWLVHMRRLPAERMLDALIKHGAIGSADLRAVARVLAEFYLASPPLGIGAQQYRRHLRQTLQANCAELADPVYGLARGRIEALRDAQLKLLEREPELFDARVAAGRVVEGHGDLRPEHVCLEKLPVIFDCLEFNREMRIVDTADELAFLAMECERIGAPGAGAELFGAYAQITGDQPRDRLVHFYEAYRACLWAKLAVWHTRDGGAVPGSRWHELACDYLSLAETYCRQFSA